MNPRSSSCSGKALAPARSLRSHRTYAENTEKLSYCQPDQRFRGAAYEYVRVADSLPSYEQIAEHDDPLCRVKLFLPGSRFTYYACALTNYDGMLVLSGYVLSPLDPDFDAFEDARRSPRSPQSASTGYRQSATCSSAPCPSAP